MLPSVAPWLLHGLLGAGVRSPAVGPAAAQLKHYPTARSLSTPSKGLGLISARRKVTEPASAQLFGYRAVPTLVIDIRDV